VWCNGKELGILSSRLKVVKSSIPHACILYSCLGLEKPPKLGKAYLGLKRLKKVYLGSKRLEKPYLSFGMPS
jgi:hypothetical protein